ncbi:MAG: hypothetical protein QXK91_04695 [Nitrososphaerales archaeon]
MTEMNLNLLGKLLEEEMIDKELRSIPQDLYRSVALFLKNARNTDHFTETLLTHLKAREKELILKITLNLLQLRLTKAKNGLKLQEANLLAEERYILEAEASVKQRINKIENALKNGQVSLLTSIQERSIKKLVTLRFLKPFDAIIGVDLQKYGPFQPEDVATIPLENAKPLISQGVAIEILLNE